MKDENMPDAEGFPESAAPPCDELETAENSTFRAANAGSLKSRIDAAGITDGVFASLEAGEPLRVTVEICAKAGIPTSAGSMLAMRRRHLADWQAQRLAREAEAEGISAGDLRETVQGILLARIGRFAHSCTTLESLRTVGQAFADWTRASVAERAEARAERDSLRKLAMKIDDLLADEERLAAVKRARDAVTHRGTEARLEAISVALWGDCRQSLT
jgi:hypothetical protein